MKQIQVIQLYAGIQRRHIHGKCGLFAANYAPTREQHLHPFRRLLLPLSSSGLLLFLGLLLWLFLPIRNSIQFPNLFTWPQNFLDERILVSQQPTTELISGNLVLWSQFLDKFEFIRMQLRSFVPEDFPSEVSLVRSCGWYFWNTWRYGIVQSSFNGGYLLSWGFGTS